MVQVSGPRESEGRHTPPRHRRSLCAPEMCTRTMFSRRYAIPNPDSAAVRAGPGLLKTKGRSSGDVSGLIHAAGVSPTEASPETILKVDRYGTALMLEEFGNVIAHGGAEVVIAWQFDMAKELFRGATESKNLFVCHRLSPMFAPANQFFALIHTARLLLSGRLDLSHEHLTARKLLHVL